MFISVRFKSDKLQVIVYLTIFSLQGHFNRHVIAYVHLIIMYTITNKKLNPL